MYDGAAINKQWQDAWPTDTGDATDARHEHSPVLQAPVANLLGEPWYLESGSPGGDFVTWLDLPNGGRVGVSPHAGTDGIVRWVVGIDDADGNPIHQESTMPITATPEVVADRVRAVCGEHGIDAPDGPDTLTRLPHTGMRVPDTDLIVTGLKMLTTEQGVAFTGKLRSGRHSMIVGTVENTGQGGPTVLHPHHREVFGEAQLDAYAGQCRTEEGGPVTAEDLLNALITEADWTRKALDAYVKQRLLLRLMDHSPTADDAVPAFPPYPQGQATSAKPTRREHWEHLTERVAAKMPPGRHGWWQAWHTGKWVDVTPRPDYIRADLYG